MLQIAGGERAKRDEQTAITERTAESGEHLLADFDVAEPEPARIVPFEQGEVAVEGARMDVENVLHANRGPGLPREEGLDDLELFLRVSAQP